MSNARRAGRRPTLIALTSAVAAVAMLAACSSSGGSSSSSTSPTAGGSSTSSANAGVKHYVLAGTAGASSDAFFASVMCGGTKEAKAEGSTITWKPATTDGDAQSDQADFDAAKLLHPDGVVLMPQSSTGYGQPQTDLMNSGVPVVIANAVISEKNYYQSYTSTTAADDPNVGKMGQLIATAMNNTGSIAVLGGIPGNAGVAARWKPMVAALKAQDPKVNVLATQYDSFDKQKATTIISSLIVAHPDMKAVYAINSTEGEGAIAAVNAAGKQSTIKVYTFDATPDIVSALRAGTVPALLAQAPGVMGADSVKAVIAYLNAHPGSKSAVPVGSPQDVLVPTMILTKDNIDSAAAQGYIYSTKCSS